MANEEQQEEIEAICAIFEEEFTEISNTPPCFMIKLQNLDVNMSGPLSLKVTLPPGYPGETPTIEIPMRSQILSSQQHKQLLEKLQDTAEELVETPMVYSLIEAAKDWLNDNFEELQSTAQTEEAEEEDTTLPLTGVSLVEPKVYGGRWDYIIGLVGKPSSGKSTFFNAATTSDIAKTGAHPFTTIEPNRGKAFYAIPCPCGRVGEEKCNAAHGHNVDGERLVPVLLKDVAGLVPGAADGKGRGNRFLNEICDADVLIHIVDVSGTTDEKGDETSDHDPTMDVVWLKHEIFRWIYDNVKLKWDQIMRRPQKLVDMFTGYHATKATIHAAFQSAEIGERELSNIANWTDELARIVTHFVQIRFPIFLAFNKSDLPTSKANIERILAQFPDAPSLPVCAKTECQLQRMGRDGKIQYDYGTNHCEALTALTEGEKDQLQGVQNHVWNNYGSTNIVRALSCAVSLRQPVYAFPVADLDTLYSIGKPRNHRGTSQDGGGSSGGGGGGGAERLRDTLMLKPNTSTEELHRIMTHYPLKLLAGDFIRAECLDENGKKRIMRKDEIISNNNCVLRILTNKKSAATS